MKAYAKTVETTFHELNTNRNGLSEPEASKRLQKHGPNVIDENQGPSIVSILLSQFQNYLVYILFIAVLFSLGVGLFPGEPPRYNEAVIIFAILISNGLLGFYQDYRAERSIAALKDQTTPNATVNRDGEKREIDSEKLVPGDVIFLDQGDAVPADARLIEVESLATVEASLTGESTQVHKSIQPVSENKQVGDRENMVFKNTNVVRGRAVAVVTKTGMNTEIGTIAEELQNMEDSKTPFQQEVDELGRRLGILITGFVAMITVIQGVATGTNWVTLFLLAIGMLVAAIPESLPVVVTFALARGSRRMLKKNALVRRLPVVESLGSVNYILTDKTGTLTQGTMTVRHLYFDSHDIEVTGIGTNHEGGFQHDSNVENQMFFEDLLRCGRVCNNVEQTDDGYDGDPTEIALYVAAEKAGITDVPKRERTIPFEADRKRMTVVTTDGTAYMKGAPETILDRCDRIIDDGETRKITNDHVNEIKNQVNEYANDAMRVLAFARKTAENPDSNPDEIEHNMIFLGLQAMIDPPREDVREAVEDCRTAGINVVMATGDDITTASAIGHELGFSAEGAVTGEDIEEMNENELSQKISSTEIFARVSPTHKVQILDALKKEGLEVAMTGDGVNDAPALKDSDVGVAMGQQGTDVAKQSSDIILRDDNFVTIRDAIKEGRTIFDNIRKVTNYLLSTNSAEVMFVFLGALISAIFFQDIFGAQHVDAVVLTAVMILWVNFSTDGPPSIAMASDESVPGVMERPPRKPGEPIIDSKMISMIAVTGPLAAFIYLPLFFYHVESFKLAQTILFTGLALFELVMVQIVRREYKLTLHGNIWLLFSVLIAFAAQVLILYTPLNHWFEVIPLGFIHWVELLLTTFIFTGAIMLYQQLSFQLLGHRKGASN